MFEDIVTGIVVGIFAAVATIGTVLLIDRVIPTSFKHQESNAEPYTRIVASNGCIWRFRMKQYGTRVYSFPELLADGRQACIRP